MPHTSDPPWPGEGGTPGRAIRMAQSDKLDQLKSAAHAPDVAGNWLPVLTAAGAVGGGRRRGLRPASALPEVGLRTVLGFALLAADGRGVNPKKQEAPE